VTPAAPSGRRGAWVALGLGICVGATSFTLIKVALDDLSPLALAAGRVCFAALAFVVVVAVQPWRRRPVAPADRLAVVTCGLGLSAGFHLLYTFGQGRVSVTLGAIVLGCMPVVVALLEVAFLGHRLGPAQTGGLLLCVGGALATSLAASSGGAGTTSLDVVGLLAVVAATVVWGGFSVVTRSLADRYDPWWLNTPGTVLGALVMLVLLAATGGWREYTDLPVLVWGDVVWLGAVSSAFIYAVLARAMQYLPATAVTSVSTLITPLGVLIGWAVLGEQPGPVAVVGGVAVVVGAVLVTRPAREAVLVA
jgi:drug/metabolite transporter (DMT)-like permease